jgi:hypothetical protein
MEVKERRQMVSSMNSIALSNFMDRLSDLESDENGIQICVNQIQKSVAGRNVASDNALLH